MLINKIYMAMPLSQKANLPKMRSETRPLHVRISHQQKLNTHGTHIVLCTTIFSLQESNRFFRLLTCFTTMKIELYIDDDAPSNIAQPGATPGVYCSK